MNSFIILVIGLLLMALGYFVYGRFIAQKILALDPDFNTPSHEFNDGVDFVPTNKYVLWGHHFTSVAGAAPIVGPAIAVIWGWLPAFLWVVLGTIFFAGVHDMSAVWASVRNKGRSIGAVSGIVLNKRVRALFSIVIFLLLLMVNAVFAVVIAGMMINTPSSVVPVWGALVVAFFIGQAIYRWKLNLPIVSLIGVVALYFLIYIGPMVPLALPSEMMGLPANAWWIILLFVYAAIASLLPVWMLLQPRDYINGLQLFVGLFVLYLSFVLVQPEIVAPAINRDAPPGTPPIMPLLFVTIACGAISGFHGLVSTGTTSKQINREPDARFVGYFGAMGEGMLALASILAATAGFATLVDWQAVYVAYGQGGVGAFITGGANIMNQGLGISQELSATMLTVMAALFAGTTMDTGVRLQRYIFQEWGEQYNIKTLQKGSVATLLAVGSCLLLAFGAGGIKGTGGMTIWPLFGTTNQIMAGLTLLVVSVMLLKAGRRVWFTLIPMVFLLTMTVIALLSQLMDFYENGERLLVVLDIVVLICSIWVILESIATLKRYWPKKGTRLQQ
ncbi:carbon starvation protein A [Oligella urethralis]|uniref:Carbon starvation protein CstA n=1 Tax=Oligella urethralis DNF00040 TaxID=1401065 RepID=A0A095ZD44_9BURK|nr:carbon starvation protein A [Oligella urethralis]KGF32583.1 carbon starvation protein CstA [Oligella urethralis DNF00040]SUA64068.1 Carbon starvation protein A [Oligella urethralis]